MTDRDLTPDEEERVRRLLADARHSEPMPDDVVARLDAVLADLAEESAPSVTVVTSLDAARRRRGRGRALLVAAAAVTVLGVGTPALMSALTGMGVSSNDSATSGEMPEAASDGKGARDNAQSDDQPEGQSAGSGDQFEAAPDPTSPPAALSSQRFKAQVKKYAADADARMRDTETQDYSAVGACVPQEAWGSGDLLPATYDGELGMLVYRAPRGDVQRVDLYLCGTRTPVRSVLIPMP